MKRLYGFMVLFTSLIHAELYEFCAMQALSKGDYEAFVEWFEKYTHGMLPQDQMRCIGEARKFAVNRSNVQLKAVFGQSTMINAYMLGVIFSAGGFLLGLPMGIPVWCKCQAAGAVFSVGFKLAKMRREKARYLRILDYLRERSAVHDSFQ